MAPSRKFSAFLISFLVIFSVFSVSIVRAIPPQTPDCSKDPNAAGCNLPPTNKAPDTNVSGVIPNPFTVGGSNPSLVDLLTAIFQKILLPVGSVLAVMAFIWTGFKYVMAAGNPKKIEDANRALMYTAIGTAVLLGATLISEVIKGTLTQLQ